MSQMKVKPMVLSVRTVLIAALAIIVSAGIVDGKRRYDNAKAADGVSTQSGLRSSNSLAVRSL